MANVAPPGLNQFFDNNGDPLALGSISTFDVGTSTPRLTWSDAAETVPNNPVITLDAAGRAQIFYRGNYKLVCKDAGGATLWTVNGFNVPDVSAANAALQFQVNGSNVGTAGQFVTVNLIDGLTGTAASSVLTLGLDGLAADANHAWTFSAPSAGATVTVNSVQAVGVQVNGPTGLAGAIVMNSDAATHYAAFNSRQAGTNKAFFGADGTQVLVGDSTNGDTVIRGESGTVRVTVGGTTSQLAVSATATAVEGALNLSGAFNPAVRTITANYTLVLGDAGRTIISYAITSAKTLTIPPNSSVAFAVGTRIFIQVSNSANHGGAGTGHTTFARGAGVSLRASNSGTDTDKTVTGFVMLVKIDTDDWFVATAALT